MNRINYAFLLIAVFVLFGFYSFLLVKFNESYETRAMPEKLQQFEELGKRIVEFYRLQGRFPSSAQELDERSIFLISDPSSGIFIDYSSQRIRYNFEGDGFDLFAAHCMSFRWA